MNPRSTVRCRSAGLAFALVAGVGCSSGSESSAASVGRPTVDLPYVTPTNTPDATATTAVNAEDATPTAASHQGSPLCDASHFAGVCYPDDPATMASCGIVSEAGPDGDEDDVLGCHVVPGGDATGDAEAGATVLPICMAAGPGVDGISCSGPTDCAAGFECVGSGTCRHYCCDGGTSCGSSLFCDTQPLAAARRTNVPVCMPIQPCTLLATSEAGTCPNGQTCAVVRIEDGITGCVAVGEARAGESCDTEHCGAGLTCSGTTTRMCFTLCHTQAPVECSSGQACKSNPTIFPNPAVGICQ